ncbi:MAG: radical SAM family heme chaperone HemW [Planctomycetaceae bacterium]
MSFPEPRAAYVHVPFCVHRCGYCDFTLVAGRDDLIGDYLKAIEKELASLQTPREIDTLFFGGGTPTQLSADQLRRLFEIVNHWLPASSHAEVSVEANPDGFTSEKVAVLADAGVNRISLGIQSFDADVLRILERQHSPDEIRSTVDRVRQRIPNVSLDLIFGVPGQSLDNWAATLEATMDCDPNHISTYGLTFEKGTAFWSRREHGDLIPVQSEVEREMYQLAMNRLPEAGYQQYELSNFARSGFRCRHNEVYWAGSPFFAFGPGAARYIDGRRETNHRSVFTWLGRMEAGRSPVMETEEMTPEERAREGIMLGFRRTAGINRSEFEKQFGLKFDDLAGSALNRHLDLGNLDDTGQCVRLSYEGRFIADSVIVDFL